MTLLSILADLIMVFVWCAIPVAFLVVGELIRRNL